MSFAGVSIIGDDGKASGSDWDTAADSSDSGYHLFVVRGYSRTRDDTPNGKGIKSRRFRVGGYRWVIRYFPNGTGDNNTDYISFYLRLVDDRRRAVADHPLVQIEFSFVDQVEMQEASFIRASSPSLNASISRGYSLFVKRSLFERSSHLKNDSFTVRCDLIVTTNNSAGAKRSSTSSVAVSSPPASIQQHLRSLLLSGDGADVTFEVGGETFAAHRCVLAARSPVFKAELFSAMKEGTTTSAIRIDDMEPKVFRSLLSFIYTDSVAMPETEDDDYSNDDVTILWQHLLVAADFYNLEKLKLICEDNLLCRSIGATTVASIHALAELHNCHRLKRACLDYHNVSIADSRLGEEAVVGPRRSTRMDRPNYRVTGDEWCK